MIDLSHLTEEERGTIMTVLIRDAELKRAEEERIRLEHILKTRKQYLKYLTGEWFYEAKSNRHTDTIHGSEIILASIKRGRSISLDGSIRLERSKTSGSRSSDIVAPQKPERSFQALQVEDIMQASICQSAVSNIEKENRGSSAHTPKTPRRNPFNRTSISFIELHENIIDQSGRQEQEPVVTVITTESTSPLRNDNDTVAEVCVISEGSIKSATSSVSSRPVPKKRTFLSRRSSSQSEKNSLGSEARLVPVVVVPSPRGSLHQGSTKSSKRSNSIGYENTIFPERDRIFEPLPYANPILLQSPTRDVSTFPSQISERLPSSVLMDRLDEYLINDVPNGTEIIQIGVEGDNPVPTYPFVDIFNNKNVDTTTKLEVLSLPQSIVDPGPPVSYDLHFIDKADQQIPNLSQKREFRLSTQTSNHTGDEDDSITKVLDWFSRSVDSTEWLNNTDRPGASNNSEMPVEVCILEGEDSVIAVVEEQGEIIEIERFDLEIHTNDEDESRETEQTGLEESTKIQEIVEIAARDRRILNVEDVVEVSKSVGKAIPSRNKGLKPGQASPDTESDISSVKEKYTEMRINNVDIMIPGDDGQQQLEINLQEDIEIPESYYTDTGNTEVREGYYTDTRNIEVPEGYYTNTGSTEVPEGFYTDTGNIEAPEGFYTDTRNTEAPEGYYTDTRNIEAPEGFYTDTRNIEVPEGFYTDTENTEIPEGFYNDTGNTEVPEGYYTDTRNIEVPDGYYTDTRNIEVPEGYYTDTRNIEVPEGYYTNTGNTEVPEGYYTDTGNIEVAESFYTDTGNEGLPYDSEEIKLPEVIDSISDTEALYLTNHDSVGKTANSPESEIICLVQPATDCDSLVEEIVVDLQDQTSDTVYIPNLDTDLSRVISESEKVSFSRETSHSDHKSSGSNTIVMETIEISTHDKFYGVSTNEIEERSISSKEEDSDQNRATSPQLGRLQNTAERIRMLQRFFDQERHKPMFYVGTSNTSGDRKDSRGSNKEKLSKRFTKSEYDLRSLGDDENSDTNPTFSDLQFNQRMDVSPSLSTSRSQFNSLLEFWDEASSSSSKKSYSSNKIKCAKRKGMTGTPPAELLAGEREILVINETRSVANISSLSAQRKQSLDLQVEIESRAPNDSKPNPTSYESGHHKHCKKSSKDWNGEEKPKLQVSPRKEIRSPKRKKDSFENSSNRGNSLRKATSLFTLNVYEERDPRQANIDVSPVRSQSRKQRQVTEKGAMLRKPPDDAGTPPRARAFVPTDYRHYLGMDGTTNEETEGMSRTELELSRPVRASTPVSSEERHNRRRSKSGQRILWAAGQESPMSSTAETWSNSTKNYDQTDMQDPVIKALRRAETRPKNLAKSMEDITGSSSPRQERRPDPTLELRRISNASSIPSPSPALFSDPDHTKKMSKSVPLFSLTDLSGSVMTMYNGDIGNVEVQGTIQFSINYIQRLLEFHIFVAECRDLAAGDPKRGRSDPYVKSYLVPDRANFGKRKTSIKKKTLNPSFNEILRYHVRMEYLRTQTLILSVWHNDTFGRNCFLGEVDIDLSNWDFDHTQMNVIALKPRTTLSVAPPNVRGEMRVAIRFLPQGPNSEETPSSGEIHIWIKDCKNLPLIRAAVDPYVKCFVLPDTSKKSRQKTRLLRRTANPVFNHTMVYDGIRESDLREACVELTVWDRDRLASNLLGGLRLGTGTGRSYGAAVEWMDSSPYEVALWERMMGTPNEWVEDVLPLRLINSAKTTLI
ncbi:uncharacterized protein sytl2b isoform X2 [Gouania willdenowi]|uniref:uncharacterized protein sytl2b isoform X2 n=1 Tax=Gouania willdenowi TaxID=441366 RepID=UPI001055C946|nr:uncharacterized protein LOC114474297 isoform X2 [Gouania willdenowi]